MNLTLRPRSRTKETPPTGVGIADATTTKSYGRLVMTKAYRETKNDVENDRDVHDISNKGNLLPLAII